MCIQNAGAQAPASNQTQDTIPEVNLMKRRKFNEEFLEKTLVYADLSFVSFPYCEFGPPKSPYILSADIRPQFLFGGVKSKSLALHIIPRFKVRQFWDESKPVRTPSFMPGAALYFKSNYLNERSNKYYHYAGLAFSHHSNGQDGNALNADGSYNTHTGTFSTNYLELSYHLAKSPDRYTTEKKPHYEIYSKIGYEYHPFGLESEMIGRYGRHRANLKLGLISNKVYEDVILYKNKGNQKLRARMQGKKKYKISEPYIREYWRIVLNASFIADNSTIGTALSKKMNPFDRRINADISWSFRLPGSSHVGLMATTGYYGSDPYNAYFENSFWFWRFGFSFGNFIKPGYKDLYRLEGNTVKPVN